ncbi:hypothetical protein V6N13_116270 [Hibiscus sabdariffa]
MIAAEARGNNGWFQWWGTQMVTRNKRLMVGVEQRDEEETMGTGGAQHEQRELNSRGNGCESVSFGREEFRGRVKLGELRGRGREVAGNQNGSSA